MGLQMTANLAVPLGGGIVALAFALYLVIDVRRNVRGSAAMQEISESIRVAARSFLHREFRLCLMFIIAVGGLLAGAASIPDRFFRNHPIDYHTALGFALGAACAMAAAAVGLAMATRANTRTTEAARLAGTRGALGVALGGGGAMGLTATGLVLLGICVLFFAFEGRARIVNLMAMGMGASLIALMLRIGGGIYSKSADISADLAGKLEADLLEDDPRNAAAIADNVGDNVGGVAGAGTDLMDSQLAAILAATSLAAGLDFARQSMRESMLLLPAAIAALGAIASIIGICYVRAFAKVDPHVSLKRGIQLAAVLTIPGAYLLCRIMGGRFTQAGSTDSQGIHDLFFSVLTGIVAGVLIALISQYYTASRRRPTQAIIENAPYGPALTVLEGLSVGMRSCAAPTFVLAGAIAVAHACAGTFGVGLAACGMFSITSIVIAVNAFGPIADNAGGIAQMARVDRSVREITDNLNAAGYAQSSTCRGIAGTGGSLVSVVLVLAFCAAVRLRAGEVALSNPFVVGALLLGSMTPFYFGAMIMRALSRTTRTLLEEARRQLYEIPGIMESKARPDYAQCAALASTGSIAGMARPTALALILPVAVGLIFGREVLAALLIGALATGLPLGLLMANAGGALDCGKRTVEEGNLGGRGSLAHTATLIGDSVGDPLKDAIGPSIGMLVKLMGITALTLAPLLREFTPWLELLLES